MAISKPTPKDVGNYEAKFVGPFTKRQLYCIIAGVVPCFIIANVLKGIGADGYTIAAICMMLMLIPGFFAFGQNICYGMKPEDFLIEYYQYRIKSKKVRLYETNSFDDKLDIIRKKKEKEEAKKLGIQEKPEKTSKKKDVPVTKTKFKDTRFKTYGHVKSKEYRSFS